MERDMTTGQAALPKVVPAQLSFLAIYNPVLGSSEQSFEQQLIFWYSKASRDRRKNGQNGNTAEQEEALQKEKQEKLRQIGLAQGMVDFARSFANGQPADSVETEKCRIVIKELERDWWILASIQLAQIPVVHSQNAKSGDSMPQGRMEYSAREVSPPSLLITQLLQAHRIFLLHHGGSLSALYVRHSRQKFCAIMDRFWVRFAQTWDVLLHGNPAVDIYDGLKLAAGGELGMGVGEEEWGSGEREVLEDFARRTEGLVDLVVARYGEPSPAQTASQASKSEIQDRSGSSRQDRPEPWMGAGHHAQAPDGIVFSGVGAISRASLRDISNWMQCIYTYADYAYGVRENPSSERRKRKRKQPSRASKEIAESKPDGSQQQAISPPPIGIPRPIVTAAEHSLQKATAAAGSKQSQRARSKSPAQDQETWAKYLTLGYGTVWGASSISNADQSFRSTSGTTTTTEDSGELSAKMELLDPDPEIDVDRQEEKLKIQIQQENGGHFIIGLKGDVTDELADDETSSEDRILLRTLYVGLECSDNDSSSSDDDQPPSAFKGPSGDGPTPTQHPSDPRSKRTAHSGAPKLTRLRVVVYVHRPFIHAFLFQPRTESLSLSSFYRNLHAYLAPLHRPLSASTSPTPTAARDAPPIFDLVFDPETLNVHASIPNVPLPAPPDARPANHPPPPPQAHGWTRADAINVHAAVLQARAATAAAADDDETERSVKTARGWWVVWMRLDGDPDASGNGGGGEHAPAASRPEAGSEPAPAAAAAGYFSGPPSPPWPSRTPPARRPRQAFLVRRAHDTAAASLPASSRRAGGRSSSLWTLGFGGGGRNVPTDGGGGLTEGVSVDARGYVEGLVGLGR